MAENIKIGGGSLSLNRDRTEERHPNYKGKLKLERNLPAGTIIWLAAWKRDGDDGKPWLSIAGSISDGARPAPRQQASPSRGSRSNENEFDDEIPF